MRPIFTLLLLPCFYSIVHAQWNPDTLTGGVQILSQRYFNNENETISFSDCNGGMLNVYEDYILTSNSLRHPLFMKRYDSTGVLFLQNNRSPIRVTGVYETRLYSAVQDSAGGAYFLYKLTDTTDFARDSSYFFIQHIDSAGQRLWNDNGILVRRLALNAPFTGKLCTLTGGDVAVVWRQSYNSNSNYGHLRAQKFLADGSWQWQDTGINVCSAPQLRGRFNVCSDGDGGIFLSFEDNRNQQLSVNHIDIYAQHITANGSLLFGPTGEAVIVATSQQCLPQENSTVRYMLPDGEGGCYLIAGACTDGSGQNFDYYIQRITASGQRLWAGNGAQIVQFQTGRDPSQFVLLPNPAGGVSAVFDISDYAFNWDGDAYLYLQNISTTGQKQFNDKGKPLSHIYTYPNPRLCPFHALYSNNGDLFFIFKEFYGGNAVKIQRLKANGNLLWDSSGNTVVRHFAYRLQLARGDSTHMLLQWADSRYSSGASSPMGYFASRINDIGMLSSTRPIIISKANGDWNNPATWLGERVPGDDDIVAVKHAVTVSIPNSCYSIWVVEPGGDLQVAPNAVLNILH